MTVFPSLLTLTPSITANRSRMGMIKRKTLKCPLLMTKMARWRILKRRKGKMLDKSVWLLEIPHSIQINRFRSVWLAAWQTVKQS